MSIVKTLEQISTEVLSEVLSIEAVNPIVSHASIIISYVTLTFLQENS